MYNVLSSRWRLGILYVDLLIDWCLPPTLTVFQLYRGVNKFYILDTYKTLRNKICVYKANGLYVQIKETLKG